MKYLLTITTLVLTVMFLSPSFAGWTKVTKSLNGDTFYVDFERIRKVDGFVYYWELSDLLKPNKQTLSAKIYIQGDCKLFRHKTLSGSFHTQQMGGGAGDTPPVPESHKDWQYSIPDSSGEKTLKVVCAHFINGSLEN